MNEYTSAVTVLSEQESWELVRTQRVGRLVTRVGEVVDIAPINFVVDGSSLVFRTAAGSKLSELTINDAVVFQVDSYGGADGWSVVLRGTARVLEGGDEVLAAAALPLRPFVSTVKPTFVRIEIASLSGRSFVFGPEPDLDAALQDG
ncbi:pyridoxamine 5'-phosphate oxidase family protein [Leucobacter insecticola]|uniref:Pyridoxamine 5'-phosphate oxidase family protein n=1 Tax=Leucobacter insecticola TaxID=2714934 RepID=A0A6G8FI37_9MICO|nr:pyridoxamine 5'-phosphate oxidase family protein [Leucobacter insecticola]QIM16011.1 pyridoxamine 5'-phosphate oxidase family protein [Leucobacter insecticola]